MLFTRKITESVKGAIAFIKTGGVTGDLVNPNTGIEEEDRKRFWDLMNAEFPEMEKVNFIYDKIKYMPCNLTDMTKLLLLLIYIKERER